MWAWTCQPWATASTASPRCSSQQQVDAARRQQEKDQISGILAQQEMFDYVEYLKHKAKVKIVKPVTAPVAAAPEAP